jgi:hypothetical protein
MQITTVHHCKETQQVTVQTSNSSTAITARCLGVLATDSGGNPTHLVLDRLLFSGGENDKLTGVWSAKGCYVTELVKTH